MAAIDDITDLAQDTYITINGSENDDTGDDLTTFQNDFIRSFNLWLDEYETETYWNQVRFNDYPLASITNTTTYSFDLPDDVRTPIISPNKYLKFVSDGTVIAQFKMVDPSQVVVDDDYTRPDRAAMVGRKIILSRAPKEEEVGSSIVLDVQQYFPRMTRTDSEVISLLYNKQIAVLGIAKNSTLSNVTKVSLSPSFAQKYANELKKAVAENNATTAIDEMRRDDFSTIGGIW